MIRNILLFFVLFYSSVAFAQVKTGYIKDSQNFFTIKTIKNADFIPFKNKINKGLNNGVYWLKIENQTSKSNIVQFPNNHINQVKAFIDNEEIEQLPSYRFMAYDLPVNKAVFIKITTSKEAFIPLVFYKKSTYNLIIEKQTTITSLFYGFALMVIIINLFYFISFKENTFGYYALFLTVVIFIFSFRDGMANIIGVSSNIIAKFDIVLHSLAGLTGAFFGINYLRLKDNYPKVIPILFGFVGVSFVFSLIYLYTDVFLYQALSDIAVYFFFFTCWFVSILLFKKHTYAAIFCIAYFLMVLLITDFFIFPSFGINGLGVSVNTLKIGGYIEMVVLTFGVVLRMRSLRQENTSMHNAIYEYTSKVIELETELKKLTTGEENIFTEYKFSDREIAILKAISQKKTNAQIAEELFISRDTVKYHLKKIYQKFKTSSREEIALKAKQL